jgi:hypothetical protein
LFAGVPSTRWHTNLVPFSRNFSVLDYTALTKSYKLTLLSQRLTAIVFI